MEPISADALRRQIDEPIIKAVLERADLDRNGGLDTIEVAALIPPRELDRPITALVNDLWNNARFTIASSDGNTVPLVQATRVVDDYVSFGKAQLANLLADVHQLNAQDVSNAMNRLLPKGIADVRLSDLCALVPKHCTPIGAGKIAVYLNEGRAL